MSHMVHKLVKFGQMRESDYRESQRSGVSDRESWQMARLVGGAILLAGVLVLGLVWLGNRDAVGWKAGKQARAGNMGQEIVLNNLDQ